jgi:hypothetical protein
MTQNPGQWGPQGGYPPQGPGGGYPPQGQGGYPQQPAPGYPPQQGGYNPQGTYAPQGGYPPQGPPGGYGQPPPGYGQPGEAPPPGGGYPPAGGPAPKKGPGLIIGIVVAAIVLLAAIGGIIMVLNRDSSDQPPPVSITPTNTAPPTDQPTPSPSGSATTAAPSDSPRSSPSETASEPPSGSAVDLGNGINLSPASGWEVQKTAKGVAQLSNGQSVFLGQVIQAEATTNPGQLCDAWHRKVAEDTSNGKFQDAKSVDLGTTKLTAGTCLAEVTVSNGQGSTTVLLFSLVSVRTTDGLTVIGTASFPPNADADQLNSDFSAMVNSMLRGQAKG